MNLFKDCVTPLSCESSCGSLTYGYHKPYFDWEIGRIKSGLFCGGCDAMQSKEFEEYLNSTEYAKTTISNILEGNLGDTHQILFFEQYFSGHERENFLMRMIEN